MAKSSSESGVFRRVSGILQQTQQQPGQSDEEAGKAAENAMRTFMSTQASWGANLLTQLVKGEHAGAYDKMQPAVLNSCEALAFVNSRKGGFGVTIAAGYGFVIKKTAQDAYGNSTWSNPLFFKVSQLGAGLSAGYQHCQSVIALLAPSALEVFKHGTTSMGTELGLFSTDGALTGMSGGAALGSAQHLGINVDADRTAFCYSVVDGAYLELSLHGSSITPDHSSNKTLYGELGPDEILGGKGGARVYEELLPLMRTINDLGRAAVDGSFTAAPSK